MIPDASLAISTRLRGQRLVSLRPLGGHTPLRRIAARYGMRVLALSPWKLVQQDDPATRAALTAALQADVVVVTSPTAVTAASHLHPLHVQPKQTWVAVGTGTAQSLRRAGIYHVLTPEQMDSEGLLTLQVLRALHGQRVGLVTAPGGRGLIAPTLQQRGACVLRADVYTRVAVSPAPAALTRLAKPGPLWLALTSQGALAGVLDALPTHAQQRLREARVVTPSARLAQFAREMGFSAPVISSDARPVSVLRAITEA